MVAEDGGSEASGGILVTMGATGAMGKTDRTGLLDPKESRAKAPFSSWPQDAISSKEFFFLAMESSGD